MRFVDFLGDLARQSCTAQGRRNLVDNDRLLDDLERCLDEGRAVVVIRNLAATECCQTRSRLRRFIPPLLDSWPHHSDLKFQALCNLVQKLPAHARAVFPKLPFESFYNSFGSARALLFACIRCDDSTLAAFVERRDLLELVVNVNGDLEWAMLTTRLLLQKSRLNALLSLSPDRICFVIQVLESDLRSGADIVTFVTAVLESWLDKFKPLVSARSDISEAQLDLLYAALLFANEAILVPGAVIDHRLSELMLQLLAACSEGDRPQPTRIGLNHEIPKSPRTMKRVIVRLLANLAAVDSRSRRRIGQDDALLLILNQTKIDDQNPFIREWVIVAIRHLTESDPEVQKRIANIQTCPLQTVDVEM